MRECPEISTATRMNLCATHCGLRQTRCRAVRRELREDLGRFRLRVHCEHRDFSRALHYRLSYLSQSEIVSEAQDLYARWPGPPAGERRTIVEAIVEKITISKDEVDIDLFYNRQA